MKTALYARVSTKAQDNANQEPALLAYAKNNHLDYEWYRDTFTGTSMKRPDLDRLMHDILDGKINKLVVWRLDRLGRTARGLLDLVADLERLGVEFVSLRDSLDLSTATGRLMLGILASVAEYENEVKKERMVAGIARVKAQGKRWGGSVKGRRWKVTPEKQAAVRALAAGGMTASAIARQVKLDRKTVVTILKENGAPGG